MWQLVENRRLLYGWEAPCDGTETSVEGHEVADAAPAAACQMAEVSSPKGGVLLMELPSKGDILFLQRPHFYA